MSFASVVRRWTSDVIHFSSRCKTLQRGSWRFYSRHVKNNSSRNETQTQNRHFCDKPSADNPVSAGRKVHRPTDFEKKILVYNGTYPTVEAVPKEVTHAQILRAKDYFRIRVNIGMGIATVIACVFVAYFGKKAAREGQSVSKMNFEMHRKFQEESAAARKNS